MSAEELFNAREVAASLGLAGAMLRRYSAEYERIAGEEITVHKRDGRLFTHEQVEVLKKARALVSEQGLSVRAAVQIALGKGDPPMALRSAERPSEALRSDEVGRDTLLRSEAFAEVLTKAVQDGNRDLLEEMKKLNEALVAQSRPPADTLGNRELKSNSSHFSEQAINASRPHKHGVFVRFALWLENFIRYK